MRIPSVWNLSALFFVLLLAHTAQVHAIWNGMNVVSSGANGIFMFSYSDATGNYHPVELAATASNVKYARCMVTAKHVIDRNYTHAFKGDDLRSITPDVPQQEIVRTKTLAASFLYPDQRDIGVAWLSNELEGTSGITRILLSDYSKWAIAKADGLGLTADADELTVANGIVSHLVGYGHNDVIEPFPETAPGAFQDVGIGRKRGADPVMTYFREAGPGASIWMRPRAGDAWRHSCEGDSGAPLQTASTVHGVLSRGTGGKCVDRHNDLTVFSVFTDPESEGVESNWQEVNRMIEEVCVKSLTVHKVGALGKVEGTLSPGHEWPPLVPNLKFTDDILCGDGVAPEDMDCVEDMHEGMTMTLEAIPGQDSAFDYWYGLAGQPCPCQGSDVSTCVVPFDDMGYYAQNMSIDESLCVALFEYAYSSSAMSSTPSSSPPASSQPSSSVPSSSSSSSSASSLSWASSFSSATSMSSNSSASSTGGTGGTGGMGGMGGF